MQSGGPTPVINRSLVGIVREAASRNEVGGIYGAVHGLEGLLAGNILDFGKQTKQTLDRVANTPAAALGSTRRRLRDEDIKPILDRLKKLDVRYCFIIGGNDSADTGLRLGQAAENAGLELHVLCVPKTIDNDLVETDHSPGYGSAARFVALATMGAGRDAEAMGIAAPITVIEAMGRDAGWLAAAAALARRDERDAPHALGLPEIPINEDRFLTLMENAYRGFGFAVAVVAENAQSEQGRFGGGESPQRVDDFGHPYFQGAGGYLSRLLESRLKVRVRYEHPGTIQRTMAACVSRSDATEAEMVGRAAVRFALDGHTGHMVALVRNSNRPYECTVALAPLERVAGQVKRMPDVYLDVANYQTTPAFTDYAQPLIGPLPRFGRLDTHGGPR